MNAEQAYIDGFVKRAAEYGLNASETQTMLKKAFGEEDGPYRQDQAAKMMADEQILKAIAHNREKHKGHYYLNPFVGGPLSELVKRLSRRYHATAAGEHGALIEGGSHAAAAATALGVPFVGGLGAIPPMIMGNDKRKDLARKIFEEHASKHSPE